MAAQASRRSGDVSGYADVYPAGQAGCEAAAVLKVAGGGSGEEWVETSVVYLRDYIEVKM